MSQKDKEDICTEKLNSAINEEIVINNYNDDTPDVKVSEANNLKRNPVKQELNWANIIGITIFHILAIYFYLTFPYTQRKLTLFWCK